MYILASCLFFIETFRDVLCILCYCMYFWRGVRAVEVISE